MLTSTNHPGREHNEATNNNVNVFALSVDNNNMGPVNLIPDREPQPYDWSSRSTPHVTSPSIPRPHTYVTFTIRKPHPPIGKRVSDDKTVYKTGRGCYVLDKQKRDYLHGNTKVIAYPNNKEMSVAALNK